MFKRARVKLTAYYILILMAIMLVVSAFIYKGVIVTTEKALAMHERRIEMGLQKYRNRDSLKLPVGFQKPITEDTVKEIRSEILTLLGVVNGTILVITGGLSYMLAGITLKPIQKMMSKQERFISDASHELKTPLTAMKTSLEVNLKSKKLNLNKTKEIIRETIQDIDNLTSLTNFLLKESRYQLVNVEKSDKINLSALVKGVVGKMKASADERKISISLDVAKKVMIDGNRQALKELVTILLDNAIKFNKKNGVIEIHVEEKNSEVVFKIVDNGHGIDEKDLPYIFDRFYKSEKSRSKKENDGFGLGLSIAQEIVNAHNGTIEATSETTNKPTTTFTVKLPKDR